MKKKFIVLVFSMGILLSCSKIPEMKVDIDRESFEKEYAAWEAQHIENYLFTFDYRSNHVGLFGPATISVQNNVSSVLESQTPHKVPLVQSVKEIFDFIGRTLENFEKAIEDNDNKNKEYPIKSITLIVIYNQQYHYPEKVKYGIGYYVKKNDVPPPGLGTSAELNITEFVP